MKVALFAKPITALAITLSSTIGFVLLSHSHQQLSSLKSKTRTHSMANNRSFIVWLHGLGDSGPANEPIKSLFTSPEFKNTTWSFPSAPSNSVTCNMFEILSRATLKDIGRCRLVSKAWNLLTYDTSFKQEHSKKTKKISGFFIRGYARKPVSEFVSINALDCDSKLSLDFLPGLVQIEASTKQGILLCVKSSETRILGVPEYFVCKPSTKQWQQILNPKTWYETKRCAMVVLRSNPLHYIVVRFSEPQFSGIRDNSCYSLWCEIFDSATWAWKKLEDRVRFPEYEFLRLETCRVPREPWDGLQGY